MAHGCHVKLLKTYEIHVRQIYPRFNSLVWSSLTLTPITSLLMGLEILDIRTTTKIFCAFSIQPCVAHIYYKYKVLATAQSLVVHIATVTILASYYMHLS